MSGIASTPTDRTPDPNGDRPPKGRGRIACAVCGDPTRDHRVGFPCDKLAGERITVGRPKRREARTK